MKTLLLRSPLRGIAISGHEYDADIQKSLDAGFVEHLTKPVAIERLLAAIKHAGSLAPQTPQGFAWSPTQLIARA